ncbi:bifunctional diaminohydroxyphosphoribosylaminopyrimidine deaminase/5-amino-6-(5-phosphoribosylamino)uracil reductase RibD [Rubrimonas cliftonensis]|uniref:bifunctional diaminohydroxyphosphoribosylaminopyrimidine deaminase/5-amino-6-(5-phosphoribosylamino)uracil reductase RibD n=1 Tax=Rubrimonas cliftonensis TaxID=89524 RepID=UPI000B8874C6
MRRALSLAERMRGHVWPNPPVGCVIVKDGTRVAEAATHPGGRPHAERVALDRAGADAGGATLYVTLEPCCHWGETPPCADAIVTAGVSRVVCAVRDPDPRVNGGGFARLRAGGVEVTVGVLAEAARRMMSGFFHRVRFGSPEIVVLAALRHDVPPGVDALLTPPHGGRRLVTRSGDIDIAGIESDRLLDRMNAAGLTSVALLANDPLIRRSAPDRLAGWAYGFPLHRDGAITMMDETRGPV